MHPALQTLCNAGVPIRAERAPPPTSGEMAVALREVAQLDLEPWVHEAVGAWVLAWAHEWPTHFRATFGGETEGTARWARAHTPDPGRYLKLRRIAISNLAGIL